MVDMHIHTIHSDGTDTVQKIFELANKLNISTLSITDHNTVTAYEDIINNDLAKIYKGNLVTGVELKCHLNKEIIELLVYDFEIDKMNKFIDQNYYKWEYINKNITTEFEKILINNDICYDKDIMSSHDFKKHNGIIELYKSMMKIESNKEKIGNNKCEKIYEFFRKFVCDDSNMFYVDSSKYYISAESIIEFVRQNGGKIFMPHVYLFNNGLNILKKLNNSIDGVECYHSSYTLEQCEELLNYCRSNNLYISAGSDYHGKSYDLGSPSEFYDDSNIKLFEFNNQINRK